MRLLAQAGFILFALTITEAQVAPHPAQRPPLRGSAGAKPSAAVAQPALAPEVPQRAFSLLDEPAKPAQVEEAAGKLSVKADNSSLSEILHAISTKTGMTVQGLGRDQRIFGSYGPSNPREVLSALLEGLDYNVVMVGALSNGAPRQLTLTPRTGGGGGGGAAFRSPIQSQPNADNDNNSSSSSSDDEDDSGSDQPDSSNPQPPRPEPYPPETNQQQEQPQQPGQVKTPQQMLQELQQMRARQQQQANPQ